MSRSPGPANRGLALERTILAWNRSALSVVVYAALMRHLWPLRGRAGDVALGLVAAAAILWAVALFVFTTSKARREPPTPLPTEVLTLMTAGTLILAAVGFALAFVIAS